MQCVITGGRQRKLGSGDEWNAYDQALIGSLDMDSKKIHKRVTYISPPEVCPDFEPSIVFKASHLVGDELYVCTQTEIISYKLPSFEKRKYISNKIFNDLHHVQVLDNKNILVANTGLDMVVELTLSGEIVQEWDVLGDPLWERFDKNCDYRKIATTKPHKSHPNYVFTIRGEKWVTRLAQKDAICLTQRNKHIPINIGYPHDGRVVGDDVFFTTTNGYVVQANVGDFKVSQVYDLNSIVSTQLALGWCRGIDIFENRYALVGFSRMRKTKIAEHVEWLKARILNRNTYNSLPTRISCFDLKNKELCWESNLEEVGINAVFSINILK